MNLDGIEDIVIDSKMDIIPPSQQYDNKETFVNVFAGKSQKGYVPFNIRKVNQDYMLTKEDAKTKTLILGAFDGHGEHGHCISEVMLFLLFKNRLFAMAFTLIWYRMKNLLLI